jgi:cytochrome c553
MADYKSDFRKGGCNTVMVAISKQITDAEIAEAAAYFASLKRVEWTKVVETEMVAKSVLGVGGMRYATADGAQEPIGSRIIELPVAPERMAMRDSRTGFIAYAPKGSLTRGEALVNGEGGKTVACASCHGADLRGLGDAPYINGRSPMYVFRQLNDIKLGQRSGPSAQTMLPVVANLSQDDMVAISAYLASRAP